MMISIIIRITAKDGYDIVNKSRIIQIRMKWSRKMKTANKLFKTCMATLFVFTFLIGKPKMIKATTTEVYNLTELLNAVDNASSTDEANPDIIILKNDISLTATLQIKPTQVITLKSGHQSEDAPYKLIGANGSTAIRVDFATLNIDGITITHISGQSGRGVTIGPAIVPSVGSGGKVNFISGLITANTDTHGAGVYNYTGTFNMYGGVISNNTAAPLSNANSQGGGVNSSIEAITNIYGGTVEGNQAYGGGGIYARGVCNIEGVIIDDNYATGFGGGIYLRSSTTTISNTTITNNHANRGGGVLADDNHILNITESIILDNTAINYGGGIYSNISTVNIQNSEISRNVCPTGAGISLNGGTGFASATISNTIIKENTATYYGGGIHVNSASVLYINAGVSFVDNQTTNTGGGGGAIYTEVITYANLNIDGSTIFKGNKSVRAFKPASTTYPNIGFSSTSIDTHPVNNYDINYWGTLQAEVILTYDANGGVGGTTVTKLISDNDFIVLSAVDAGVSRAGYNFIGWNTEADGSGTDYSPDDIFNILVNTTLYVVWSEIEVSITYDTNTGVGGIVVSRPLSDNDFIVLSDIDVGVSLAGHKFVCWNTEADRSGIDYNAGDSILDLQTDIVLFAQWQELSQNPDTKDIIVLPIIILMLFTATIIKVTKRKKSFN